MLKPNQKVMHDYTGQIGTAIDIRGEDVSVMWENGTISMEHASELVGGVKDHD